MICKTREKGVQTPSTTHPCNSLIIFCDLLKIMWSFLFFFFFELWWGSDAGWRAWSGLDLVLAHIKSLNPLRAALNLQGRTLESTRNNKNLNFIECKCSKFIIHLGGLYRHQKTYFAHQNIPKLILIDT